MAGPKRYISVRGSELSSTEEKEFDSLLENFHQGTIDRRLEKFRSLSSSVREQIIFYEELREFYMGVSNIYGAFSPRLDDLVMRGSTHHANRLDEKQIQSPWDFLKNLPPSLKIPLELLKRAHTDACAEEMLIKPT